MEYRSMLSNLRVVLLLLIVLPSTALSCATSGVCGGGTHCAPAPQQQMQIQLQCEQTQCPVSYGCAQYGCYKLRSSSNQPSGYKDTRHTHSGSQDMARSRPLMELDDRSFAAAAAPTFPRSRAIDAHAPINPNQVFVNCCMDRKLPDACLSKCNFNAYTKQTLTSMYLKQDPCPLEAMSDMQFCAAQGRDHTDCCIRNGVITTLAGTKCLVFCNQTPGTVTQLDISYLACFDRFESMKTCFWHHIVQHSY